MEEPLSLEEWLQERYDNCVRIAAQKDGEEKRGWLVDAQYFDRALRALAKSKDEAWACPPCTCNSPYLCVHASWCDQYKFWE